MCKINSVLLFVSAPSNLEENGKNRAVSCLKAMQYIRYYLVSYGRSSRIESAESVRAFDATRQLFAHRLAIR